MSNRKLLMCNKMKSSCNLIRILRSHIRHRQKMNGIVNYVRVQIVLKIRFVKFVVHMGRNPENFFIFSHGEFFLLYLENVWKRILPHKSGVAGDSCTRKSISKEPKVWKFCKVQEISSTDINPKRQLREKLCRVQRHQYQQTSSNTLPWPHLLLKLHWIHVHLELKWEYSWSVDLFFQNRIRT